MMMPTGSAPEKAKDYFRREMQVLKDLLMPNGRATEYRHLLRYP